MPTHQSLMRSALYRDPYACPEYLFQPGMFVIHIMEPVTVCGPLPHKPPETNHASRLHHNTSCQTLRH